MLITDPVADMIIRIKNAILAKKADLSMPHSKLKANMAKLLVNNNYIKSFKVIEKKPQSELSITLKYLGRDSVVTGVKQISKPGRRVYSEANKMPRVMGGHGIAIISTNKGVITAKQAHKLNVGGEVLCHIW